MTPLKRLPKKEHRPLTDVELELMTILWRIKEGSVHDVIEQLAKDRSLAYTSVSTILRILEQKQVIESRKEGRGHIYYPIVSKTEYEASSVKRLVETVFDGAPTAMVKQLLNSSNLTQSDLKELKHFLNTKLENEENTRSR